MFRVTRWVVVPWERRGGALLRGECRQFYTREEAAPLVERLRRRHERVDFYEVSGWPVQDLWDRPRRAG